MASGFPGKVAFVTGGASGIGAALATKLGIVVSGPPLAGRIDVERETRAQAHAGNVFHLLLTPDRITRENKHFRQVAALVSRLSL